jgi:hypothetical protein
VLAVAVELVVVVIVVVVGIVARMPQQVLGVEGCGKRLRSSMLRRDNGGSFLPVAYLAQAVATETAAVAAVVVMMRAKASGGKYLGSGCRASRGPMVPYSL